MTLSHPDVIRRLNESFVVTWFNQAPEVFPPQPDATAEQQAVPEEYKRNFPDGAGGANVKLFFCTPAGQVVHFAQGFYRPETFLEEVALALELVPLAKVSDREARLRLAHGQRLARYTAELERARTEPRPGPLEQGLLRVRANNHRLALERLLRDPEPYMVNEDLGFR